MTIAWQRYDDTPPLPERVLLGAETLLDVVFPSDYRECVRQNHGAGPQPDAFTAIHHGEPWNGSLLALLSLDPYAAENVFGILSDLVSDEQLPAGVVPIGDDGEGNYLCLDYRGDPTKSNPVIAYWFHELGGADGIVPVADSFTAFLGMLREPGGCGS